MTTFSERLNQETAVEHDSAEATGFIDSLMAGQRSAEDFGRLINQYAQLYPALERAVDRVQDNFPHLEPILDPLLNRADLLVAYVQTLEAACGFRLQEPTTAATAAYIVRLNNLGTLSRPLDEYRVLAHHYLRYLGDLSGGQIIRRLVSRHYDIPDEALTTWDFSHILKLKRYKDQYRELLNKMVTDPAAQKAMIDEALTGFRLNAELFSSLADSGQLTAV